MLELFKYITSDFWIFVGTSILLGIVFKGIATIIHSIRGTVPEKNDD